MITSDFQTVRWMICYSSNWKLVKTFPLLEDYYLSRDDRWLPHIEFVRCFVGFTISFNLQKTHLRGVAEPVIKYRLSDYNSCIFFFSVCCLSSLSLLPSLYKLFCSVSRTLGVSLNSVIFALWADDFVLLSELCGIGNRLEALLVILSLNTPPFFGRCPNRRAIGHFNIEMNWHALII